jgi:hypothetical protein
MTALLIGLLLIRRRDDGLHEQPATPIAPPTVAARMQETARYAFDVNRAGCAPRRVLGHEERPRRCQRPRAVRLRHRQLRERERLGSATPTKYLGALRLVVGAAWSWHADHWLDLGRETRTCCSCDAPRPKRLPSNTNKIQVQSNRAQASVFTGATSAGAATAQAQPPRRTTW